MKLPVLMYHKIGNRKPGQRYRNLSVNPRKFANQLGWLKRLGYRSVTFQDLARPGFALPAKPVVLTFDDGYEDFFMEAMPAMEAAGFRGCVCAVAGLAGKTNEWSKGRSDAEERLMTFDQLRQAADRGHEVVCHSMSHTELKSDDPALLEREMGESKRRLEAELGRPVVTWAWPFGTGADSPGQREFLVRLGYSFALGADGGMETWPVADPLGVRRIALGEKDGAMSFLWKLW